MIAEAHEHIERYLGQIQLEEFLMQQMLQDAVTMRLQQALECANKLSAETRAELSIQWASLSAMRNKISHAYDDLDMRVVWGVVREFEEFARLIQFVKEKI